MNNTALSATHVKHFLDTIGIAGLLKLLLGEDERECCFKQCLAYYEGNGQPKLFCGEHTGIVSKEAKGKLSKHDWSELSYIFIPEGKEVVLAEMTDDERIMLAKENEENSAFKHFKEWYIDYLASEEHYKKKTSSVSFIDLMKNLFQKNKLKKCHENYIIIVTKQGEWFYGKWHIYRN